MAVRARHCSNSPRKILRTLTIFHRSRTHQVDLANPTHLVGIAAAAILVLLGLLKLLGGSGKAKFLNKTRQTVTLGDRVNLSHDTVRFRFLLPKATPVLGLPVGKHFKLFCPNPKGKVEGKWNGREDVESDETEIERKYTPTSSDDEIGYVDLVIKVYKGGVVKTEDGQDKFPDGGKMSQYMDTLKVGDTLDIMGPVGTHEYLGKGKFKSGSKEHSCKKVGMMAGGTGITPMLQVIAAILKDPSDTTEVYLLYANQTEDDILCRDLLEDLQKAHPKRLKIHYTLDRPPKSWKYSVGFITDTMIAEHLPGPKESSLVLMCGPPPMVRFACQQNLDKLGFTKAQQIAF